MPNYSNFCLFKDFVHTPDPWKELVSKLSITILCITGSLKGPQNIEVFIRLGVDTIPVKRGKGSVKIQ
jgi:hypothetical protein